MSDVVIGHSLEGLHPSLKAEGKMLARLTKLLARDVIRALGSHRERILDMELVHQRITAAAMELYVMGAVISKLQAMAENPQTNGHAHEQEPRHDCR